MNLTLVKTMTNEIKKEDLYTIGEYKAYVSTYADGGCYIYVNCGTERYRPAIYCVNDSEGRIRGFEIQTTSYGTLNAEEIQKVIAGYNKALAVVEILTKEFVK